jgi:hypothetical protein
LSIRLVLRRSAGLIAAAGNLYQGVAHVPKSVKRGQSFVFPIWYMERSADNMQVMATGVSVTTTLSNGSGVRVDWLDPVTKRWEPTTGNWGTTDSHYLQLPAASRLVYRPGFWAHVYVRVTFTSKAHLGSWWVAPNTPYEYQLWTKSGQPSPDFLNQPMTPTGAAVSVHA